MNTNTYIRIKITGHSQAFTLFNVFDAVNVQKQISYMQINAYKKRY